MRRELVVKSKTLAGVSDLTLFAPIRQGFVASLDSVTYKTRLQMLLKTLSASRASSQEHSLVRPFSDSVERVAAIHSVRLAIVEPENKLMLAATFDGSWETYIRTLWLKVGTLLDVIFCNTEGYVTSHGHSCDEWAAWARSVQAETQFFYGMPMLSVPDVQYLRQAEKIARQNGPRGDALAARAVVERPEDKAWRAATGAADGALVPPEPRAGAETLRQGLQALAVLYRLTEVYLPGTPDGDILLRAARDLLLELVETRLLEKLLLADQPPLKDVRDRFERQLRWFVKPSLERTRATPGSVPYDRHDVQAGILSSLDGITHGCLLLIGFSHPGGTAAARQGAAAFLSALCPQITRDSATPLPPAAIVRNVAFTFEGLRALGLSEAELDEFPREFREGMEARASVLGDFRSNHPRRWKLPLRNWPALSADATAVELSAVHMVVQLRVAADPLAPAEDASSGTHPFLHAEIQRLMDGAAVTLLSVQPMRRNVDSRTQTARDHFGFVDGISQPVLEPGGAGQVYDGRVPLGDILLGYPNTFDPAPPRQDLLHNGSFLVVRKLRQDVAALRQAVASAASALNMAPDNLLAKMMGRKLNGTPLAAPRAGPTNDFNYAADPHGKQCPFQSHVRRANPRPGPVPRTDREPPVPRIMRRGMSYGPPFNQQAPDDPANAQERGIVFMAYNTRIAEQFEAIQRWLAGGNSSGGLSTQSDPFLGVPQPGDPRSFRFLIRDSVKRAELDDTTNPPDEPRRGPFVQLEWGAYLFAPSIKAVAALQRIAEKTSAAACPPWSVDEGARIIEQLLALASRPGQDLPSLWKEVLEDPTHKREFRSAAVWAAVRERHGGVLRTPLGVLVAAPELVDDVFADPLQRYTVQGYRERTGLSFGEIYLGLDRDAPGGAYDTEATLSNQAIQAITLREAFDLAEAFAQEILTRRITLDQALARRLGKPGWELNLDTREVSDHVLARLCQQWFGLPEKDGPLRPGGLTWDWVEGQPPLYPGHFTAPSRYVFQPAPGACPAQMGQLHGRAIRQAVKAFAEDHLRAGTVPSTPAGQAACVGEAIFTDPRAHNDPDWFARTFVGALVGFLPSVDGNFRATLNEWLRDGEFWRLRSRLDRSQAPFDNACAVLLPAMLRTMQLRPIPETVWRRARKAHRLGAVDIQVDDLIVVAIISATQADLLAGKLGVKAVFGGERCPTGLRPGDPTHACPGYHAGMGALLGLYSALLTVTETLRPSPAPLSLTLSGRTPP